MYYDLFLASSWLKLFEMCASNLYFGSYLVEKPSFIFHTGKYVLPMFSQQLVNFLFSVYYYNVLITTEYDNPPNHNFTNVLT